MRETRVGTHHVRHCIIAVFSALLLIAPAAAQTQTVNAAWDASPASDQVTGYQVCVGTSSLSCNVALASVSASTTSYTFTPSGGILHYVAVRATNAAGVSSYSSEVTFSIPSFTQPLNQSSPAGTAIPTLNLSVNDPDGDTLHFTHTGLPPGLSLSASTGRITGTPSAAGTYNVTVFVTDALATVSRSFVWTVTGAASDTTAPALTITSHTSGQTLTTQNATISGTASDSGRGGNGITTVMVNGLAATGATASGSGTANWSRAVTLSSGANTISVEATDGAGNVSMQQITLTANLPITPVTGATLTPSLASPRNAGTQITLTASGSGGVSPRQYKFLIAQGGGAAQTVQNWSTDTTYTWTPSAAASYALIVWARSAGVTTDAAQASAQVSYTINPAPIAPVTSATLTSNLSSPRNTGTQITFTASGSGGVSPRQYKFRIAQGGGAVQTVQNWSTTSTYTWTPSTAASYTVTVWVRSAGVTTDAAQASAQMSYVINTPSAATVSAVSVTPSSGTGATQTFTLRYADSTNASGMSSAWAWFTAAFGSNSANSCLVYYNRQAGTLNLLNDAANQWTPATLGTAATLRNTQCSVALAGSSVLVSGTTLTVNLAMTFSGSYAGSKHVYLYGANTAGVSSGWQDRGDWTVPAPASAPPPVVSAARTISAVSVTPSAGSGTTQTFALQYAASAGASSLATTWVWFSETLASSSANSCLLYYSHPTATLYLINDAGSDWRSGTVGTNASLQNSHCSVSLAGSSASLSGTDLTLNLPMTFSAAYAGAKNVYMFANNVEGSNSGWQDRGDWTVTSSAPPPSSPAGVSAISATPSSGSGATQTFALRYSDSSNANNLATTWVWFSPSLGANSVSSCLLYYERPAARLYLLNDAGNVWQSGALGSGTSLQNDQCSVALSGSSVSLSGTNLTLNLAMTFRPSYAGAKQVYLYGTNEAGVHTGWQDRGDWTVPSAPAPAPTPVGVSAVLVTPSSGSGATRTFALQYGDSTGAANLATVWAWFNAAFSSNSSNSCLTYYDRVANTLYLQNDKATAWIPGTLGSGDVLANSQCSITLNSSFVSVSGTSLTLNLAMSFRPQYAGSKNIYMYANNAGGTQSGWQKRGSWIVP